MKKIIVVLLALELVGCGISSIRSEPLTPQEQVCAELRRNITFNADPMQTNGQSSSSNYANMLGLYKKNGCVELEK